MLILKGGDIMPRLDKTGPRGEGPKTGRGVGLCNNPQLKKEEVLKQKPFGKFNAKGTGRKIFRRGVR